jgi:hypothetical protein
MKTLISAIHFKEVDPDHNQSVEVDDIVRVLAKVKFEDEDEPDLSLTAEKAHALALAILHGEDDHDSFFSFVDFMETQDNGTMPFSQFIRHLKLPTQPGLRPSDQEIRDCERAFEEGQRQAAAGLKKRKKWTKAAKQAARVGSISAQSVNVQVETQSQSTLSEE